MKVCTRGENIRTLTLPEDVSVDSCQHFETEKSPADQVDPNRMTMAERAVLEHIEFLRQQGGSRSPKV